MTHRCVVALGANLGQRAETIHAAVREVSELSGTQCVAVSSLYQSAAVKPEGVDASAPEYLNAVMLIDTVLSPTELLEQLHRIEQAHGRERHERWGDRTLDLDIIDYDNLSLVTDQLTLPHPRAHERCFVMAPWAEIEPHREFGTHGAVSELARDCERDITIFEPVVLAS